MTLELVIAGQYGCWESIWQANMPLGLVIGRLYALLGSPNTQNTNPPKMLYWGTSFISLGAGTAEQVISQ